MRSLSARWIPAVAVTLLLAIALLAPMRNVRADRTPPETDAGYLLYTGCTYGAQSLFASYPADGYAIPAFEGVLQPIGAFGNAVACSLSLQSFTWSSGNIDVVGWDPATLAPPAGSIALRSFAYAATYWAVNVSLQYYVPAIVTQSLPNVAEAGPTELAIRLKRNQQYDQSTNAPILAISADGPPAVPAAHRVLSDGSLGDLAGAHPVAVHAACAGDGNAKNLRVVQSVVRADEVLDPIQVEYIQKFRLPVATQLQWIELALSPFNDTGAYPAAYGHVSVVDAAGQSVPPVSMSAVFGADFPTYYTYGASGPAWRNHYDAGSAVDLQANHDYWLVVTTWQKLAPMAHVLTGTESPYFQTSIGPLFRRATPGADAELFAGRALDFRMIGVPAGTVGVPLLPARPTFALRVSPNPARGATAISWTGATGSVALEVLDPRGRRVASATSDAGRWAWKGTAADGAAIPAGVYFVRARDDAGREATARVTFVR